MNMQALLKQAQKMQKDLSKAEAELKQRSYESTMGGGLVKVVVQGTMEVTSITINEELLTPSSKEDLETMVASAVNDALKQAVKEKDKMMNEMTGGVKMPGGF